MASIVFEHITKRYADGLEAVKDMKTYNFGPDFLHPELKAFVYG